MKEYQNIIIFESQFEFNRENSRCVFFINPFSRNFLITWLHQYCSRDTSISMDVSCSHFYSLVKKFIINNMFFFAGTYHWSNSWLHFGNVSSVVQITELLNSRIFCVCYSKSVILLIVSALLHVLLLLIELYVPFTVLE